MTEHYKGYDIGISSKEQSGGWQATAKIILTISGTRETKSFVLLITDNLKTQVEAEAAALTRAKQEIDQRPS